MKINKGLLAVVFGTALLIVGASTLLPNKAIARTEGPTDIEEYRAFVTVLEKNDVTVWSENEHGTKLREVTFMGYDGTMFRIFLPQREQFGFGFRLDTWRFRPRKLDPVSRMEVGKNYLIIYQPLSSWPGVPKQLYEITHYEELHR